MNYDQQTDGVKQLAIVNIIFFSIANNTTGKDLKWQIKRIIKIYSRFIFIIHVHM